MDRLEPYLIWVPALAFVAISLRRMFQSTNLVQSWLPPTKLLGCLEAWALVSLMLFAVSRSSFRVMIGSSLIFTCIADRLVSPGIRRKRISVISHSKSGHVQRRNWTSFPQAPHTTVTTNTELFHRIKSRKRVLTVSTNPYFSAS